MNKGKSLSSTDREIAKQIYTAYFYSDGGYAKREIEAADPQEALAQAKTLNESQDHGLIFSRYDEDQPVNHIEILAADCTELAHWHDRDLLVRMASPHLLKACRLLIRAYALGEENNAHVDWNDVDRAHDAAQLALEMVQS